MIRTRGVLERAQRLKTLSSDCSDAETALRAAENALQALRALAKLREALQTLPFFGGGKVVWLQNCNFLADDRTSSSSAVNMI